jgi:DNA-binding transcriptional LysR family regulator
MELRHLRYFDAVARTGNFTRAADMLGIAQPPLSRQIRDLEIELGVALIDRESRPIRLTQAGRACHDQVSRLLAGVEELRRSMRAYASVGGERRFVVGFVGSVMYGLMPTLIRQFRAQAPDVDIQLIELTTLQQVAALKEGRIDVGLGRIRVDDPAVRREVLYEEPLVLAAAADSPIAGSDAPITLAEIATARLLVYPSQPRPSYADQVLGLFRDHGLQPRQIEEVREVQTALGLVAADAGVAIVPLSMGRLARDGVRFRPIAEPDATSPIIFSHRVGDSSEETASFEQIGRRLYA